MMIVIPISNIYVSRETFKTFRDFLDRDRKGFLYMGFGMLVWSKMGTPISGAGL
jgi:hypothetical protein